MKKFRILASETVCYSFVIEADTREQAQDMIDQGDYDTGAPYDGDNFEVDSIIEQEQTV